MLYYKDRAFKKARRYVKSIGQASLEIAASCGRRRTPVTFLSVVFSFTCLKLVTNTFANQAV